MSPVDPSRPNASKKMAYTVHVLAIVAGALTIFATAAPALGVPSQVAQALGVVVAVLTYVANQLPALGSN